MSNYVSREQKVLACSKDLYEFLARHHSADMNFKYDSATLNSDHHISVKNGIPGYHDFRTGSGGNSIDFLMKYLGYSYPDAVHALLEDIPCAGTTAKPATASMPVNKKLVLPNPDPDYRRMFAYLLSRGIS